jgi:hypothetical protein
MKVFPALFWIVTVSFLLAGGNGFSENYGKVPGSKYVGRDSPAYASSERVVASTQKLKGICSGGAQACRILAGLGRKGLEMVDAILTLGLDRWANASPNDRRDRSDTRPALIGRVGIAADDPLFEGINHLIYVDEDDEMEDIG